jgi:hypothetical protein
VARRDAALGEQSDGPGDLLVRRAGVVQPLDLGDQQVDDLAGRVDAELAQLVDVRADVVDEASRSRLPRPGL